jgi:DUF2934 family protein
METNRSLTEENISSRAHQIWEEAGRPHGFQEQHWQQAERELRHTPEKAANDSESIAPAAKGHQTSSKARHSTDYQHPGVTTDSLHHHR